MLSTLKRTSFGDRPRILEALNAGATGYLLKDAEPEEVVRAVRAAANGDAPLDPRAAREVLSAQRATTPELTEPESTDPRGASPP